MSADFWAGYLSGAASIIIGNPLDVLKVRLQASSSPSSTTAPSLSTTAPPSQSSKFLLGTAAPILTYGALNALLFVTYNRTQSFLSSLSPDTALPSLDGTAAAPLSLTNTFASGCVAGLATFFVSTPTELIKCRAQLSSVPQSSWAIAKGIVKSQGFKGLYFGGTVTALRDSVGYGFYFWGYELTSRYFPTGGYASETLRALVCGGLAGILTWGSIFPLDVVKTRVQGQILESRAHTTTAAREGEGLLGQRPQSAGEGRERGAKKVKGAWEVTKITWREEGIRPFFRGLGVCSLRAFVVNAVQWAVYEWIMMELGEGRDKRGAKNAGGKVEEAVM
ncbi:mitochondrial carrier domain-containing protein [Cladorrhinum sp. PSN259]|nr:mitochondrial carrier domain-containing protein [Cladorrhinum sp. PSN259]